MVITCNVPSARELLPVSRKIQVFLQTSHQWVIPDKFCANATGVCLVWPTLLLAKEKRDMSPSAHSAYTRRGILNIMCVVSSTMGCWVLSVTSLGVACQCLDLSRGSKLMTSLGGCVQFPFHPDFRMSFFLLSWNIYPRKQPNSSSPQGSLPLSPNLLSKEIQPVHPKRDQSWVFTGRTDAEAETLVLWPPDVKSWLIGKDPDAGKDWGQEEKGTTEDEMVGRHHWLNGHGFGWTPGVGDGQGGLACCDSWGRKELDTTERLNWTEQ